MPAPNSTLRFSDPQGPVRGDPLSVRKRAELRRARRFLAIYYVVLPIVLVILLFKVFPTYPWPVANPETNELVNNIPIYFFRWGIATSLEDRLLLLVIVAGALGSYIHSATSYSDFRGNRQFNSSWTLWYVLRPLIGVCLAMVLYFVTRGGLLLLIISGKEATSAGSINPFGVAAVAGLTGMFSKQAADKLAEVFTTLFKAAGDSYRKDSLTPGVPPVITKIDPTEGSEEGGTEITITGTGFQAGATVMFADEPATDINILSDTTITADTPAGEPGVADVTVVNTDGQKVSLTKGFTYLANDQTGEPGAAREGEQAAAPAGEQAAAPAGDEGAGPDAGKGSGPSGDQGAGPAGEQGAG